MPAKNFRPFEIKSKKNIWAFSLTLSPVYLEKILGIWIILVLVHLVGIEDQPYT